MLAKPKPRQTAIDEEALRQNARMLESVLAEFGVRGEVDQIRQALSSPSMSFRRRRA